MLSTFLLALLMAVVIVVGIYLIGGAVVAWPLVRSASRTRAWLDRLDPDDVADRRARLTALAATACVAWPFILTSRPRQLCVHHDKSECRQTCPSPDCDLPPF